MSLIGRLIVIVFALLLASVAAGLVTVVALLIFELRALAADPVAHFYFWSSATIGSGLAFIAATLPTFIAIILAEAFKVRSGLIYALAGAVIMLIGYYGTGFGWNYNESIDEPPPPIPREAEIAVAAGAAFGVVYWAVAGRNAGRWRGHG